MIGLSGFTGHHPRLYPLAYLSLFSLVACILLLTQFDAKRLGVNLVQHASPPTNRAPIQVDTTTYPHLDIPRTACIGPRGGLLGDEDLPGAVHGLEDVTFPIPTTGSYDLVGLEKSWLTVEERYGPYGYEEETADYQWSRVNWNHTDWGRLQDDCVAANEARFRLPGGQSQQGKEMYSTRTNRFRLLDKGEVQMPPRARTGRQAIVLRTWSTYDYSPEDLWNIRSIINEASLSTGGQYTVVLLVDVKDEDGHLIHVDEAIYERVLKRSVAPEFRNIAVLFHESLQRSWYAKVDEFRYVLVPLQNECGLINSSQSYLADHAALAALCTLPSRIRPFLAI